MRDPSVSDRDREQRVLAHEDEINRAKRNLEDYHEAEAQGLGATSVDGQLVDAGHVKLALTVLGQAEPTGR